MGEQVKATQKIHSQRKQCYQCKRCKDTFRATKGTALYRARKPPEIVVHVMTLLSLGCPPQAIVAAFGWDERMAARYQQQAGAQCQRVHEHLVEAVQVEREMQGREEAVINTSCIEPLNASCRAHMAPLARRTGAAARQAEEVARAA